VIIQISDAAKLDLLEGSQFYENQEENIGSYFLDSLYSDIDVPRHDNRGGFFQDNQRALELILWFLAEGYFQLELGDQRQRGGLA